MPLAQLAAFPRCLAAGIVVTEATPKSLLGRFDLYEGRLSNVAYMAHAIDAADGIDGGPATAHQAQGRLQIAHLLSWDGGSAHGHVGLLYVALRRLQRAGDLQRMRAGLALLVAVDTRELDGTAALAALGDVAPGFDDPAVAALTAKRAA